MSEAKKRIIVNGVIFLMGSLTHHIASLLAWRRHEIIKAEIEAESGGIVLICPSAFSLESIAVFIGLFILLIFTNRHVSQKQDKRFNYWLYVPLSVFIAVVSYFGSHVGFIICDYWL